MTNNSIEIQSKCNNQDVHNSLGKIIILNGAPRSGKSSIVAAIQQTFHGVWMNLGVDHFMCMTPKKFLPGIGLRPGGERPDLEPIIIDMYHALYESIAAHSRLGLNVVVDVGHHDNYSVPRGILSHCADILHGLPVLFVGVRCPLEEIMKRRELTGYKGIDEKGNVYPPILLWQEYVHLPGIYDIEVDTSIHSPEECAELILKRLSDETPATAFHQLST
ncbi:chloramphenicol phosphotransferase CPT family protein [Clostridium polynesiense]|uniref:chloramphenicol phosphotransferase CPT family protein n=1 Tax=Clostridium polynesiense TaxID=1325933 RepID=UPI000694370B|nr:chloramphenicol phosphotransferase [Clostridium polynesiense]